MMSVSVETASGMVQAMQPCMEKAVGEVMALPQAEYSQLVNEATERACETTSRDSSCQDVPPSPSSNGSRGRSKTKPSPSANGGSSRPKPLPPWLMKIADKVRIALGSAGKGRHGGARSG